MKRLGVFFCVVAGLGIMGGSLCAERLDIGTVGGKPPGRGRDRFMHVEPVVEADPHKEGGANVNASHTDGRTSLWIASANGHGEVVKLLLEGGADVNAADTDGRTPLWIASANGHNGVVKLLLEAGAVKVAKLAVVNRGLVGHWKFDEGGGKTANDSACNNHGKIHGAKWVAGKFGGGLSFEGLKNYVDCGNDDSLDMTDQLTVSAWIKRPDFNPHGVVVGKTNGNSVTAGYGLVSYKQGLEFNFYSSQKWRRTRPRVAVTANQWHHVVGTYDGNIARLYVDGKQRASLTHHGEIAAAAGYPVQIAYWRSQIPSYFDGAIDDVRIYNRALTLPEIGHLYKMASHVLSAGVFRKPKGPSVIATPEVVRILAKDLGESVPMQHYVNQRIAEYKDTQYDIYSEYKNERNSTIVERNQYILGELWGEGLLDNQIKTEITKEKYKLVLLQVYGNYQAPNFVVRCSHNFPFPSVYTKFTPTMLINDEVVWEPKKPQRAHSMKINNSTITSRIGGVVKNGDVIQYKVLLQQYRDEKLAWETNLYTNKVVAQGLRK